MIIHDFPAIAARLAELRGDPKPEARFDRDIHEGHPTDADAFKIEFSGWMEC
jgi:hypothetical protein